MGEAVAIVTRPRRKSANILESFNAAMVMVRSGRYRFERLQQRWGRAEEEEGIKI
jgi:hypothetical protein